MMVYKETKARKSMQNSNEYNLRKSSNRYLPNSMFSQIPTKRNWQILSNLNFQNDTFLNLKL